MSGQWPTDKSEERESFTCFMARMDRNPERSKLLDAVYQLLPDEIKIASVYVESLIKTRPIKQTSEGWETTVNGPGYVEKEDRAHMATLELEADPR